ncbi:unnamed protein product [Protopolystoma xenopodis]|uniref:HMG box domain-containing protein n=1 Tax=Protopolystoma xenopodis TaxID=117903 RepID=A0A3S5ADX8_9PLAT|nr:unnamed protein product [Protopolystoma xenopodis]
MRAQNNIGLYCVHSTQGMMKDKNRPKGPMTSYACFVQVIREEHKKKHPGENVVFSEFTKKCAEIWRVGFVHFLILLQKMTPKEKKRFDDMAQLDKERYNREMHEYIPLEGFRKGKRRKRTKDPGMPKRAWSAFFFFCDEYRPRIREEHPEWKVSDIAKELGRKWEECLNKLKYEQKAMSDKHRYEEDMQKYKLGTYVPPKRPRIGSIGFDSSSLSTADTDNSVNISGLENSLGAVDEEDEEEDVDDTEGELQGEETGHTGPIIALSSPQVINRASEIESALPPSDSAADVSETASVSSAVEKENTLEPSSFKESACLHESVRISDENLPHINLMDSHIESSKEETEQIVKNDATNLPVLETPIELYSEI